MSSSSQFDAEMAQLADRTVRDLVEAHPATMTILAPLGIDLCCGGAHALGDALELHGLDRQAVLSQIAEVIAAPARLER